MFCSKYEKFSRIANKEVEKKLWEIIRLRKTWHIFPTFRWEKVYGLFWILFIQSELDIPTEMKINQLQSNSEFKIFLRSAKEFVSASSDSENWLRESKPGEYLSVKPEYISTITTLSECGAKSVNGKMERNNRAEVRQTWWKHQGTNNNVQRYTRDENESDTN